VKDGLSLSFRSNRLGGFGSFDIWVTQRDSVEDLWQTPVNLGPTINGAYGEFCSTTLVPELSTEYADYQPVLRKDGLELFFASDRPPTSGYVDLWTSTRETTAAPWNPPTNLGSGINSVEYDFHSTLSFDGTTLIFASERGGPDVGWGDLWMTTRTKLRGKR